MTATALVLVPTGTRAPVPATRFDDFAASVYAATQARRTAPAWAPRTGRIVDIAG